LDKKSKFFLIVLFFLIGYLCSTYLLFINFWETYVVTDSIFLYAFPLIFFYVGAMVSVYLYKRNYLDNLKESTPLKWNRYILLVSIGLAFFIDLYFGGISFSEGEAILVAFCLYSSLIFHLGKFRKIKLLKDKYLLALSLTFKNGLIYLGLIIIFGIFSKFSELTFINDNLLASIFFILRPQYSTQGQSNQNVSLQDFISSTFSFSFLVLLVDILLGW